MSTFFATGQSEFANLGEKQRDCWNRRKPELFLNSKVRHPALFIGSVHFGGIHLTCFALQNIAIESDLISCAIAPFSGPTLGLLRTFKVPFGWS